MEAMSINKIKNAIPEDYCSFKVAKLLKENGCWIQDFYLATYYDHKGDYFRIGTIGQIGPTPDDWGANVYQAITHARAIEWLRINYRIEISIDAATSQLNNHEGYNYWIWNRITGEEFWSEPDNCPAGESKYNSPQEAIEYALLFVLQKCIPANLANSAK